ncbi:ABC transporter ATP-binding protein [Pseudaestuariivita rosea]|uniref:ABC transporter ATP-binding protein n=1 Tax=Pseudaestuariivita rosea TaxID=2763263 RepID=UPI001ABA7D9E|nr:ABC transporter ATP-binding protein [Pseudaestuariivita rosea]
MILLSLQNLTVMRGECPVVDHVNLTVDAGAFVGLIGPNGAGKTTLMRGALGLVPTQGDSSLQQMDPAHRARHVGWLPQSREIAWPVDVRTLVSLGRIPHSGRPKATDTAVDQALARMHLTDFADRIATKLSGGEQARVLIARALAQETPLLLADEAIAGLDPANQIMVMQLFSQLATEGRGIIASIHDLGLAARHCSRLLLMHMGRVVADGPPDQVLTPDHMRDVFGISGYYADTDHGPIFQPLEVLT